MSGTAPPVEATPVALATLLTIEDTRSSDVGDAVRIVGHPRGECTNGPTWTTLANRSFPNTPHQTTSAARLNRAAHVEKIKALRPTCLMTLPYTPDAKGKAHFLAERQAVSFRSF
ncbi:MAG: hypothetical protein LC754_17485 [Acidobacteria bacterium]|nr:hypothetical protein [Acidobacteriota bacterium]